MAVTLAATAGLVGGRAAPGHARLSGLLGWPAPAGRSAPGWLPLVAARMLLPAMGVAALLVLVGQAGLAVPLAAAAVAVGLPARRRAADERRARARLAREVPRAADLMATCLDAGCSPADAVLAVCDTTEALRAELGPVAAALRAGADPMTAWAGVEAGRAVGSTGGRPGRQAAVVWRRDDALPRLARSFVRTASSGAPLAQTLASVAAAERERVRWAAEAAARRAGVRAVGPLAVCFLPAFLLLGVVPVVVGVAVDAVGGLR